MSFLIFTLDGADYHMITDKIVKTKNLPIIILILLIKEYTKNKKILMKNFSKKGHYFKLYFSIVTY